MIYLLLVLTFFVGYCLRDIRDRLIRLASRISELKAAQDKAEGPKSSLVQPAETRAEMAALIDEERVRLLNP